MLFETLVSLVILAVIVPVALVIYAQRAYNQRRYATRVVAYRNYLLSEEAEEAAYLAQIREDTCTKHDLFCCPACFDMTVRS